MKPSKHNIHSWAHTCLAGSESARLGQKERLGKPGWVGRPSIPLVNRFWSKVNKTETCWLWTSNVHTNGYGQIAESRNGRLRQRWLWAHRVAWELTHGPIADGLRVLHRCDVPTCVNPDHLFLGTQIENIADSVRKGRFTAWRRTGVRLNGQRAQYGRQSMPTARQQPAGTLDGPHGLFQCVPFRVLPVVGEVI
jgi:hypothetical protein